MGYMMLKRRVMDPRQRDEISEALAVEHQPTQADPDLKPWREVPSYLHNWYPNGLKDRTVGPNSRKLVGITRFYPTLTPKVAIDFEPGPPEDFFEDQKRRFCTEQHIAYVPVYLHEKLTTDEFKARVTAARQLADEGFRVIQEDRALAEVTVEEWMQTPELLAALDRECLRRIKVEEEESGKRYNGVARKHVLARIKRDLLDYLRGHMKNGRIRDPLAWLAEQGAPNGVDGGSSGRELAHASQ